MAVRTVPRHSAVSELSALLDSPEVSALIAKLDALRWTGRKGYGVRALLGACLVKSLDALPTWTRVADLIAEHPGLSTALGGTPSHWACYRFARKLHGERGLIADCVDRIAAALREENPDIGREVAIDASDMPAWANGQRYLYNHGPERQAYSDPDASWGHRSAVSTRKGGGFYGYKIHAAVCARTGLPLAWTVHTGARNESLYVAPLLDAVKKRGYNAETVAMDRGYDNNRVYAECHERGVNPVIPLRKGRVQPETPIKRGTDEWATLYRRRTSVEREFGRLKHQYGLAFLRVRGIERIRLHADLVILARLGQALGRTRAIQRTA